MTGKTKTTPSKRRGVNKKVATSTENHGYRFDGHDLLVIPLLGLIGFGIYYLATTFSTSPRRDPISFSSLFWSPEFPIILVAIFAAAYIYRVIRKIVAGEPIHILAKIVAYVFAALFLWLIATFWDGGYMCTGLMGVQTRCSEVNLLLYVIYVFNPYTLPIWSLLAIVGTVMLFLKSKTSEH
jgi:hypothetical protein